MRRQISSYTSGRGDGTSKRTGDSMLTTRDPSRNRFTLQATGLSGSDIITDPKSFTETLENELPSIAWRVVLSSSSSFIASQIHFPRRSYVGTSANCAGTARMRKFTQVEPQHHARGTISGQKTVCLVFACSAAGAGSVEPGRNRKSPGDGEGLETGGSHASTGCTGSGAAAGRPAGPGAPCAPGQATAQDQFGALSGAALEAGQVSGHCQTQLVSQRLRRIRGHESQLGESPHATTSQRPTLL